MLILTRRIGETLVIEPAPSIDAGMTVRETFASGPIVVGLMNMHGSQAQIGIGAPSGLLVIRSELIH